MAKAKPKTKPAPKLKPVTIKSIDEYLELEAERKELNRKSDLIKRRTDAMRNNLAAHLAANKSKPISKGKYRIAFDTRSGRVSWKTEFISAVGIETAEDLVSAAPPTQFVTVT